MLSLSNISLLSIRSPLLLLTHFAPQIKITDKMETKDAVSSLTRYRRYKTDGCVADAFGDKSFPPLCFCSFSTFSVEFINYDNGN